jgi:hypothetical protein
MSSINGVQMCMNEVIHELLFLVLFLRLSSDWYRLEKQKREVTEEVVQQLERFCLVSSIVSLVCLEYVQYAQQSFPLTENITYFSDHLILLLVHEEVLCLRKTESKKKPENMNFLYWMNCLNFFSKNKNMNEDKWGDHITLCKWEY